MRFKRRYFVLSFFLRGIIVDTLTDFKGEIRAKEQV